MVIDVAGFIDSIGCAVDFPIDLDIGLSICSNALFDSFLTKRWSNGG